MSLLVFNCGEGKVDCSLSYLELDDDKFEWFVYVWVNVVVNLGVMFMVG